LGNGNDASGKIDCVPNIEEKYISFSKSIYEDENGKKKFKYKIRFIDSFKFMSTSLDKLANILSACAQTKRDENQFKHTRQTFGDEQCEHLMRKGDYSYDYVDCLDKLDEKQLPPKEALYSKLSGCHISNEDYEHAQNVWKHFSIQTMKDYHNLYLKTDVLLLAEMFENFRDIA